MYQHKVDVDMLNAVKSMLADVSSVSPSSEQRNVSQHTLYGVQHIHIVLFLNIYSTSCQQDNWIENCCLLSDSLVRVEENLHPGKRSSYRIHFYPSTHHHYD